MSTAIATRPLDRGNGIAVVSDISGQNKLARLNMRELKEVAEVFIQSGSFTDVKQAAQAMVKIMAGAELGFSPIVSMTGVHFFNGKVSLGANLIASLIKDSGKYEYKITEHTAEACAVEFYQKINNELKSLGVPVRYTIAEASKAGLTGKDNWKKYPADMLFAACIRQGARRYCGDILRGVTPDTDADVEHHEIETIEPETTIDAVEAEVIEQAPQSSTPQESTAATDGQVAPAVDLTTELTELCKELNAAGDSIVWKHSTLSEYAETLAGKPLDAHDDEDARVLLDDLRQRLADLRAA